MFLRTLGREGVECPGITLLGGRKSIYSTPQRPRVVEKGARGSADVGNVRRLRVCVQHQQRASSKSRTTHVSVGSEPSWRVEGGGDENGGGGGRRGELEKGRELKHEKRRAVGGEGKGSGKGLERGLQLKQEALTLARRTAIRIIIA